MAAQQTIVVDHLARLEDGSVVVAGIDGRHEHIAPRRVGPWDTAATARGDGPFDIGMAVDIGFSRRSGTPPLVEEREVDEPGITALRRRVQSGEPVILWLGLSQAFNGAHWLRVDNIHFRDYFDDHPVFRFARGRD